MADVFEYLQSYGLKLKPKQCQLLRDKDLVNDVQEWQPPKNTQQLQAFLGLCSYYRHFITAFAELASPLTNLPKKTAEFQ